MKYSLFLFFIPIFCGCLEEGNPNAKMEIKFVYSDKDSLRSREITRSDYYYVYNYSDKKLDSLIDFALNVEFDTFPSQHSVFYFKYSKKLADTSILRRTMENYYEHQGKPIPSENPAVESNCKYRLLNTYKSGPSKHGIKDYHNFIVPLHLWISVYNNCEQTDYYYMRDSTNKHWIKCAKKDLYPWLYDD